MSIQLSDIRTRHMSRSAVYAAILIILSMMPFVWNATDLSKLLEIAKEACQMAVEAKRIEPENCKTIKIEPAPILHFSNAFRFYVAAPEWCLGILAVSVSVVLNWLESLHDTDVEGAPSVFTALSVVGGIMFFAFYFVLEKNLATFRMYPDQYRFNFLCLLSFGFCTIVSGMLSITTVRRSKDRRAALEAEYI